MFRYHRGELKLKRDYKLVSNPSFNDELRKHTYMAYLFILITVVLTHNFSDIVIATNWVGFQMGFHIYWVK